MGLSKVIENNTSPGSDDGPWTTGLFKAPVEGTVWLGKVNLKGDSQADLVHHGGPDKAVNVYPIEHYPLWREELGLKEFSNGAFGENFTTEGLLEKTVCIGDIYDVGDARVQVSQPRQPCWKIARRWGVRNFVELVRNTGRTGWYFRVFREGNVERNDILKLQDRPWPEWTLARANALMHGQVKDPAATRQLSQCPQLSSSWRERLASL